MHFGLTISVLLHACLLVWAVFTIHSAPFKDSVPEPVEVAIISSDELVRLRQGDRNAKQLDAKPKEAPAKEPPKEEQVRKVQQAAAPPPPPKEEPPPPAKEQPKPEPPKAEPPKAEPKKDPIAEALAAKPPDPPPGPTPEELKQEEERLALERKAEEEKKQAEQKKLEEEKKKREAEAKKIEEEKKRKLAEAKKKADDEKKRREAEAKKKQFDAEKIAALLNKVPDKSAPTGAPEPQKPTNAKGPVAGAPEGRDTVLTASQRSLLGAMMKRAVSRCWNINSGLEGIDRIVVDVEIRLKPDGRLQAAPRVVSSGGGGLFADAANSAVRALVQCEPYDLPRDLYEGGWDHMVVTFDPQRMF